MAQKVYYNGIFGENQIKLVRDIINIVPLHDMFAEIGHSIRTHAHRNLFQIFVLEKGKIELLANNESFSVIQPSIITIPQSVFHGLEFEPGSKGYLISLSANAVEQMLKYDVEVIYELDTISITGISQKNQLVEDAYNTIYKCIFEYDNALPGKDLALQYLVGMLLLRLYRINHSNQTVIHTLNQNERTVFRNFKKLVQENNSIKKRVEDYASELGITVAALSQICKAISGKSPKEVILDFLILNIKSTLKNAEFSISEVSYQFDIDDPSYFARLFKQKTGQTPKQYRHNQLML
jgi:AraC family transcriptional activator of pobA